MPLPPTLDIVILIILLVFAGWGLMNGLIKAVGGIVGIVIAGAVASRYYLLISAYIAPFFGSYSALAPILAFSVLFLLIGRIFGFLVYLFEKAFDILAFIPFLKTINRLAGALFGLVLAMFIIGPILYVAGKYSPWVGFNNAVAASTLAQIALAISNIMTPLFPEALRQLRSFF